MVSCVSLCFIISFVFFSVLFCFWLICSVCLALLCLSDVEIYHLMPRSKKERNKAREKTMLCGELDFVLALVWRAVVAFAVHGPEKGFIGLSCSN